MSEPLTAVGTAVAKHAAIKGWQFWKRIKHLEDKNKLLETKISELANKMKELEKRVNYTIPSCSNKECRGFNIYLDPTEYSPVPDRTAERGYKEEIARGPSSSNRRYWICEDCGHRMVQFMNTKTMSYSKSPWESHKPDSSNS